MGIWTVSAIIDVITAISTKVNGKKEWNMGVELTVKFELDKSKRESGRKINLFFDIKLDLSKMQ
jgi:hypothetical protein